MSESPTDAGAVKPVNPYLIPLAIVVAGLAIAGSIYASRGGAAPAAAPGQPSAAPTAKVTPVSENDHIMGPRDAEVFLIEYSDYQCPFCERFHTTVEEILKQYEGKVAWVYRHFPLDMHQEARPSAHASECVAELAGNDAFWRFTEGIFANQRAMNNALYVSLAKGLGVDEAKFNECMTSNRHMPRIDADLQNGVELGGNGTPFNVLLTKAGKQLTFSGALPKERVTPLIDRLLQAE